MRKSFSILLILLVTTIEFAQWKQVGTFLTPGFPAVDLVYHDNQLFARTAKGVYLSEDNGNSWIELNNGLINNDYNNVSSLVSNGNYLFANNDGSGVFQYDKVSKSWIKIRDKSFICLIAYGTTLYAGGVYGALNGISISTDNGKNWSEKSFELPGNAYPIAISVSGLTIYIGTMNGLYFSADGGSSWQDVKNSSVVSYINLNIAFFAPYLIAHSNSERKKIYRTTDNGKRWDEFLIGEFFINSIKLYGSYIYALTNNGVYLSTDFCKSWTNIGLTKKDIYAIAVNGNYLFVSGKDGNYFSNNSGASWQPVNSWLVNASVNTFASSGSKLFTGTSGGFYYSTNDGIDWVERNNGLTNKNILSMNISDSSFIAGTKDGVFQSLDDGINWKPIGTSTNMGSSYVMAVTQIGSNILAYSGYRYFTSNNGSSWTDVTYKDGLPSNGERIWNFVSNGTELFAGLSSGVFLSTDQGKSWKITSVGWLSNEHLTELVGGGSKLYAGTNRGNVYLSNDKGVSWEKIGQKDLIGYIRAIALSGLNVFASTEFKGVFISKNGSSNWEAVDEDLDVDEISSLYVHNSYLFAGTSRGVWRRSLSELTDITQIINIPSKFYLAQNFPNPFNPETTISYTIQVASQVSLKVYDVLGREVAILVDEFEQPGNYKVIFNVKTSHVASLHSGIYFYRLQAGSFVQAKKMILTK